MYTNKINKLVELIYESAITPSKWTELLNALAEFVDQLEQQSSLEGAEQSMLAVIPDTKNKPSNISLSETLKSISNINEEVTSVDVGKINDMLIGHFIGALKIAKRLVDIDEQHNIVLSLLDRMPIALVLVNHKAKIIEMNGLADEMLNSNIGITITDNLLDFGAKNNSRLLDVIQQMSKHGAAITQGQSHHLDLSKNNESANNIMLFIAPLKQHGNEQKASVAVFISERKAQPLSLPKEFSESFGLTAKELNVTEQLVRGLSINEISEESKVSQHTVRSQVKSVLHKTNTSRQVELVSLVYSSMGNFINSMPNELPKKRQGLLNTTQVGRQDYKVLMLKDGRNLAYEEYGDKTGIPVFHCHSVLGSRLELPLNVDEISKNKNVRLIIMDRPGFGASDPDPKSCFIKWVNDITQLADLLNLKTFSLTGYAMGGIYALACAHEMPERINKVAIIGCGVPPTSSSDFKDIIPLYKMNNRLAKYLPHVYRLLCPVLIKGILNDPVTFFSQFNDYIKESDKELMASDSFKSSVFAALKEAFRQDGKASANEVIELMHKWSFDLENIKTTIDVWHGEDDYHIPAKLGERMAKRIKNTNMFIEKGQGHYMFYTHWDEILDNLLGGHYGLSTTIELKRVD